MSKSKLYININNAAFYLLFPVFFFYQSAIGLSLFPPFLGGFFGIVAFALFPFVFISFYLLKGRNRSEYSVIDIIFLLIMLLSILLSIFNFFLSRPNGFSTELFVWSVSGIVFNLICYMLAKTITFNSRNFFVLMVLTLLVMDLIVLLNIGKRGIFFLQIENENIDSVVSYQGFARSLLVVSFYVIVLANSNKAKFFLFLIAIPVLFFNGARTEFILFILAISAMSMRRSKYSNLIYVAIFILLAVIISNIDYIFSFLPQSRMSSIFEVFSSESGQSRQWLLLNAITTIQNYPLFGDYGSYAGLSGRGFGTGTYAHNVLSAWVNLGLVGFMLYLSVMFIAIYKTTGMFFSMKERDSTSTMMFVFTIVTIIGMIFSKNYSFMLFGFMVGLVSRFVASRKHLVI